MDAITKQIALKFIPTQRQMGIGFGTILASIGIPLAAEVLKRVIKPVIKDITGQGAPRVGRPRKRGGLNYPGIPPPFVGTWEISLAKVLQEWVKKNTKGKGLLLGENSPFNNLPILGTLL